MNLELLHRYPVLLHTHLLVFGVDVVPLLSLPFPSPLFVKMLNSNRLEHNTWKKNRKINKTWKASLSPSKEEAKMCYWHSTAVESSRNEKLFAPLSEVLLLMN